MSASASSISKNLNQHRCNICNMIFDSIRTLNSHNRMEDSEARLPV